MCVCMCVYIYIYIYKIIIILTPTFLIRSPIIFIANILVHGVSGGFTLLLLLLFPVTPPTTLFPTICK